jgi:3-methyladenine DNA glycosylase AlkD
MQDMAFASDFVKALSPELISLGDRKRAIGAQAYMKDIAPFIGVATPERRAAVKKLSKSMKVPTSHELGATARKLWRLEEREFQYVANDLIGIHWKVADKEFLAEHVEHLIVTKSWWDTVDGLGSVAISPLTDKYGCEKLIATWNKSPNMWLNRAAIQHQRGRKYETDVKLILQYCDDHSGSKEFFIVKAIGWALRDIAKINPRAVREFLKSHPELGRVAVREAERGLGRL